NLTSYPIKNSSEFIGFVCGIISQDHDLQYVYADNFRKIAAIVEDAEELDSVIAELESISNTFGTNFVISIGLDKQELSPALQEKVVVAL
ncbi:MAG TPA: twitching motility protein PilT, partial [Lachnospiraceae bacterium]|nr:twitching motility protein PilT [Lachnospiraceae bacterium]